VALYYVTVAMQIRILITIYPDSLIGYPLRWDLVQWPQSLQR